MDANYFSKSPGKVRYEPLVMITITVYQGPSFAVTGIQNRSTVVSLYIEMRAKILTSWAKNLDFMGKEEYQTYKSKKILGKLYRLIKDDYDKGVEEASSDLTFDPKNVPYDSTLEFLGSKDFVSNAWKHKCSYDRQLNSLLGQYKVSREEEVVTGYVWSMPKNNSQKRGDLQEKLKHAYSALRKEFRQVFDKLGPDFDHNVVYEKKASAWYQVRLVLNFAYGDDQEQKLCATSPCFFSCGFTILEALALALIGDYGPLSSWRSTKGDIKSPLSGWVVRDPPATTILQHYCPWIRSTLLPRASSHTRLGKRAGGCRRRSPVASRELLRGGIAKVLTTALLGFKPTQATTFDVLRYYEMESEELMLMMELDRKISQIFSVFMSRVAQFEELVAVGSRLLVGFHQGLEFFRQSPINETSEWVERITRTNQTKRLLKYVEAGCVNAHDGVQNVSRLHTSQVGLLDYLSKGKCIMHELEGLVKEVTGAMQAANESKLQLKDGVIGDLLGLTLEATSFVEEELVSSDSQGPKILEYAVMMCIIYNMVKKDYAMQEKIISSLNLKSSSGELESYKLMWSLRPFVDDEIMHRAWGVVA
ncbi:hypothetical protein Vadar_003370 [Vaccinium darrowii]|uniref:Uncharacterized protein n=1 Tax=Vaccinium darrowii TaxID=229202 RepID=A0ACB7XXY3_9ERIC|nr:hypothetical protein Vadar_003370 [Vaccinium darrowii]